MQTWPVDACGEAQGGGENLKAIWDEALSAIRSRVTGENFATYFAPLRFVSTVGDEVQLAHGLFGLLDPI